LFVRVVGATLFVARMSSYIIAGQADDIVYARLEYVAQQIGNAYPGVTFHTEMKHPKDWKPFLVAVLTRYDFDGFGEDFTGPLVWTPEGELIGDSMMFFDKVVGPKFGVKDVPPPHDPMFQQISGDNMQKVQQDLLRKTKGAPFQDLCEESLLKAKECIQVPIFVERRRVLAGGATFEVWISATLAAERSSLRKEFGDGQSAVVPAALKVAPIGFEGTHLALLHPQPLARKHLALVTARHVTEAEHSVTIPPSFFRLDSQADLAREDFSAAAEALVSVGGVATWMGLKGGSEYRHPLDTYIQVLPFPVHSVGEDSATRYPLELGIERALRADKPNDEFAKLFPFRHSFSKIDSPGQAKELTEALMSAFERMRGNSRGSCMLAFTTSWMLFVPLNPPDVSSHLHATWLSIPPPPPCALIGAVVAEAVRGYPVTPCSPVLGELISNRAVEEGIPETYKEEWEAARREPRISPEILNHPARIIGVWAQ
jgi:hypothetical protein